MTGVLSRPVAAPAVAMASLMRALLERHVVGRTAGKPSAGAAFAEL